MELADLYKSDGRYSFVNGVNPSAILALVMGVGIALIGKFLPSLDWLFNYAWFVGFGTSFITYLFFMKILSSEESVVVLEE